MTGLTSSNFRRGFLILLVVVVSLAFYWVVEFFLMTIVLAALFTGVSYPGYRRLVKLFGGREKLAAAVTLVLLVAVVMVPLLGVLGAVAAEAARVNETIVPAIQKIINEPSAFDQWLQHLPFYDRIEPYREDLLQRAGQLIAGIGVFVFNAVSATTMATVLFVLHFVVMLYTMFFFFLDGPQLVRSMLAYLPLAETDKDHLLKQFVSVTRATLKGTVLIGLIQGVMMGLLFWILGIQGAIFWGTVMTVLSIIPGIGGALIWFPAAIILIATGEVWRGIILILISALVVGSVDNLLRPILVGRDTKMHELMIFFSTLGGLLVFGAMGFILGPIIAGLFMSVWDIFRGMFRKELAESVSDVIVTPDLVILTPDQEPAE
jgi:predicted PurR-regulated permease PerM